VVEWWKYGVKKPDLIARESGLLVRLADGSQLALGFSGFRGETNVRC
jgi:hypothetical protein